MSGTIQLLFFGLLFGLSFGFGIGQLNEIGRIKFIGAGFFWTVFLFIATDAFWSPLSPRGRDWIDRIGILIRGLGFGAIALCILTAPSLLSLGLGVFGMILIIFGRAFWEQTIPPNLRNKTE